MLSEFEMQASLQQSAYRPVSWEGTTLILFDHGELDPLSRLALGDDIRLTYSSDSAIIKPANDIMYSLYIMHETFIPKHAADLPAPLPSSYVLAVPLSAIQTVMPREVDMLLGWYGEYQLPCRVTGNQGPKAADVIGVQPLLALKPCPICDRGQLRGTPFGLCTECLGTGHIPWEIAQRTKRAWQEFGRKERGP